MKLSLPQIVTIGLVLFLSVRVGMVLATDPVDDLQKQIEELSRMKAMSEQATKPLESELASIKKKIASTEQQLKLAEQAQKQLSQDIKDREDKLAEQYQYLAVRVRGFYKLSRQYSPLLSLLSAHSASGLTKQLSYRMAAAEQDKQVIIGITKDLTKLEEDKETMKQRAVQLAGLRVQFEKNAKFFEGEIRGAKAYQEDLTKKISELSKRQQEILAAKTGTFQTTVGDVSAADDPASRPDYNPGFAPAFAGFSFGAPHYKGMSQYGALGRAKSGQNVETILKAYYGDVRIETKDMPSEINTSAGRMPFEDKYLKGIAEMPASWGDQGGMEALKAQAIAARTYALSYVGWRTGNPNASGSICTTEQCQVYNAGKVDAGSAAKWHEAVRATRGQVVVSNKTGDIFATWYASTSGGYQESYSSVGHTTPGFWDTPSGRGGWTSQAYEKTAGSPWFYKGWYKDRGGDNCGRSHPWLTAAEMADILNAWAVLVKSGEGDDRITPIGSCWGGNPYSLDELRDRSRNSGGGYARVTSVSVSYSDGGTTASVTFGTDKGSVTISGAEFKKAFNLRAPGKVSIKSGLYNIEQK